MKKITQLIVLFTFFFSCTKEVNYVKFSGKIANKNSDKVTISKNRKKIKTIKVDENGVFSDTIHLKESGNYRLNDGKEGAAIYLENGFDLNLTLDTKEFDETIKYTGKGSDVNNYIASKSLLKEKMPLQKLFALEEKEFLAEVDKSNNELDTALKNVANAAFVAEEKKNLKFEKIDLVSMYEGYFGYLTKNKDFKVSDSFPDVLKGVSFTNDEDYKKIFPYKKIVDGHYFGLAGEMSKKDSIPFPKAAIEIAKNIKENNIRNGLLESLAFEVSARNKDAESLYNDIMALSTNNTFKEKLTKQFEKIKRLVKGNPSPTFVNYENFKGGTTSLDDLKGKFVYVDVWATWCGPCKAEIPYLKELEKKYHGKNIHFVSMSIDRKKDHEAWKKMVKDKELSGIQLFADKDWKSDFVTEYGIQGIPRFILIDPQGNIVSADAKRPSSPKIDEFFSESGVH